MSPNATRKLLAIHRYAGLIVSLNFVVLALTGLILVFHEEIDDALGVVPPVAAQGDVIPFARTIDIAHAAKPAANPIYVFQDPEKYPGMVFVGLAENSHQIADSKPVIVDLHGEGRAVDGVDFDNNFTTVVLKIHAELFAGMAGRLFLGVVALAIVASLVTGAIVYGPTMRRFSFGLLRRDRSLRTLLADVHKLVGAATFGWNLVVASTGALLSVGTLIIQFYAMTELKAMTASFADRPNVTDYATLDHAIANAERAVPGRQWSMVALPGSDLASPQHYTVLLHGGKGIEEHVLSLAMVDAARPDDVTPKELPWFIKAVLLSEPLHFGNYGGLPLKIVWSAFTVLTLGLSASGVWVFFAGRKKRKAAVAAEEAGVPA